jgi:AcrR family transcriptional regulator
MGGRKKLVEPKSAADETIEGGPCEDVKRPLRADALRNRARVLEAAESVFAAEGISAPVDLIAEKAGVGVGTLYRHFPTKEKLFEAILIDRITEIAADARTRVDAEDPGAAFFGFLNHLVEESASKRDLIQALLGAGVEIEVAAGDAKRDLEAAVGQLLAVAQRAGAIRADVSCAVVLSLASATCMAADQPCHGVIPSEILTIICDGLRPPGETVSGQA